MDLYRRPLACFSRLDWCIQAHPDFNTGSLVQASGTPTGPPSTSQDRRAFRDPLQDSLRVQYTELSHVPLQVFVCAVAAARFREGATLLESSFRLRRRMLFLRFTTTFKVPYSTKLRPTDNTRAFSTHARVSTCATVRYKTKQQNHETSSRCSGPARYISKKILSGQLAEPRSVELELSRRVDGIEEVSRGLFSILIDKLQESLENFDPLLEPDGRGSR